MDCREFEKLIPGFIDEKLDDRILERFQEHYDTCQECREELAIQFLVARGLVRLEEGSAFDLQKELNRHIEEARRRIRFNGNILNFGLILQVAAMTLIGIVVMWILLN